MLTFKRYRTNLKNDAVYFNADRFTRQEIISVKATHVKVSIRWDFCITSHNRAEDFWCKIHTIGGIGEPMHCSVDNDLTFTSVHGLKADDPILVMPCHVIDVLTHP